jgi:hypothetical protein
MAALLSCDSYPSQNVCYDEHIVPLVKEDCATCHGNGEYHVRLEGLTDDYDELVGYVSPFDSQRSILLDWAAGGEDEDRND